MPFTPSAPSPGSTSAEATKANNRPGNQLEPALSQTGINTVVLPLLLPVLFWIPVINSRGRTNVPPVHICF